MAEAYPEPTVFLGYVVTKPHAQRRELLELDATHGLYVYSCAVRHHGN
jgi:hypothetical protein